MSRLSQISTLARIKDPRPVRRVAQPCVRAANAVGQITLQPWQNADQQLFQNNPSRQRRKGYAQNIRQFHAFLSPRLSTYDSCADTEHKSETVL